jgi:ATP-dependent protease ClpP protease subunit
LILIGVATPSHAQFCQSGVGKPTCVVETATPGRYLIEINGPIEWQLVRDVEAVIKKGGRINSLTVLESPGGDVEAAMAIGRMLRSQELMRANVNGACASACVFVIAAPFLREYYQARIGLHRPYFSTASASTAEASKRIKAMNASLRRYLEEMNVSPALLDAMNAVPSDQIRWISPAEANQLGLLDLDPVYEEFSDGKQAAKLGVTRQEYLARKARFKQECQARYTWMDREFCECVDRVKFRAPGDKWMCDYRQ